MVGVVEMEDWLVESQLAPLEERLVAPLEELAPLDEQVAFL